METKSILKNIWDELVKRNELDINGEPVTDINKFPEHLQIRQVPWGERATK